MNPEWIGMLAALLTTSAYVPQALKALRDKHTQSLSLGMYLMMTLGIGCWLIYGIMLKSPSLMLANGITFVLVIVILAMKLKHG